MAKKDAAPFVLSEALLSAFVINDRINLYLIENLPEAAWRAEPPDGKGRDVASIVAHMHNVRVMWLKATKGKVPEQLDRHRVTPPQAGKALEQSRAALNGYLIAHDAHHRGQITMLARQVGHPIPQKATFGMWEWGVR